MKTLVIGAGPAGLMLGAALARRGHQVTCVDRDAGPVGDAWPRRGVMQFRHAHNFRGQVPTFLQAEWPEADHAWRGLGAEPLDGDHRVLGYFSRRETFERALRVAAADQPGLSLRTGHVDALHTVGGRARGVRVAGTVVEADLVVDATGRSGRVARDQGTDLDGDCGLAYVNRTFRLRPGAERGPMNAPVGFIGDHDGYQCLIFPHELGHFSVVVVRPTAVPALKALRRPAAFDAACRAIPEIAAWTDPERAVPTAPVEMGGPLRNVYRRQAGLPGLVAVGDAVATTTPTRGRGVAMTCMQLRGLLDLLDEGTEATTVAAPFGAWCDAMIQPWVADHIDIDTRSARQWQGEDLDLAEPLTTHLVAVAGQADPRILELAGGYFSMMALPESLRPAEPWARAVYETGWRPPYAAGPSCAELVHLVQAASVTSEPSVVPSGTCSDSSRSLATSTPPWRRCGR